MKKIKCLINVPDKYTGREYKAGEVYEFEDARANEILACRTRVTNEPFFVEEVVENVENPVENVEEVEPVVLEDMKVAELKELAAKMNVEKADKMKKDELIEAIKNHG